MTLPSRGRGGRDPAGAAGERLRTRRRSRGPGSQIFVRLLARALVDRATYDLRRNPGLWLGFVLAVPIPVLALASSSPAWVDVAAAAAPVAWAAILGAAVRVASLGAAALRKATTEAATAKQSHADERVVLREAADSERVERAHLEKLQGATEVELALAADVHRSLLPDDIVRPDLEVVARQIACSHVGGDYLHATFSRSDVLYLCVGDVAGHGVSAALVVSRIHGVVQRSILEERTPQELLADLDGASAAILAHTSLFVTFAVFRVDLRARRIDYATAGHPAQLLVRLDGVVEELVTANGLLGTVRAAGQLGMQGASTTYRPGDTLVLFTDGLFEVLGRSGTGMLEESGLLSIVRGASGASAARVASDILREVTSFGHAGPFADDVSLMVTRLGTPERSRAEAAAESPGDAGAEGEPVPPRVSAELGLATSVRR